MAASSPNLTPGSHRLIVPSGGRERVALVHSPPPAGGPLPAVVMLHGAGGSGAWAEWETGWSAKADREGFLVVYPEALPPRPDKASKFLTNPQRWNDGSLRGTAHPTPDDDAFLRELLARLAAHPGIDASRVYVTGFSNGAGMAFRLAADLADHVAAVAPVAGPCWVQEP